MAPRENNMYIEQFVMAYEVEQDRLRALLPEGFASLRPVLRINAEIRDGREGYLEFNTPVEKDGLRGWVNIGFWENAAFTQSGKTTVFRVPELEISFTAIGVAGSCPAEKDNAGCYFADGDGWCLRKPDVITANKEFCDCSFAFAGGAHGVSQGKTLPAYPSEPKTVYPKLAFTVENASCIPCAQVLGTYVVTYETERIIAEN